MNTEFFLYPSLVEPVPIVVVAPGVGGEELEWFAQLAEPLHAKPGLAAPLQRELQLDWKQPIPQADTWLPPIERPLWEVARLHAALNPAFFVEFGTLGEAEAVTYDKYHVPLSLPVWEQKFSTALQMTWVTDYEGMIFKEDVAFDKYHYPLSLPIWPKVRPATALSSARENNRSEYDA